VLFLPAAGLADEGPPSDVAAIRRDAQLLLATDPMIQRKPPGAKAPVVIDDLFVVGERALVQWHARSLESTAAMQRIDGRWWLRSVQTRGAGMAIFVMGADGYQFGLKLDAHYAQGIVRYSSIVKLRQDLEHFIQLGQFKHAKDLRLDGAELDNGGSVLGHALL
jgi:hypothetical protein